MHAWGRCMRVCSGLVSSTQTSTQLVCVCVWGGGGGGGGGGVQRKGPRVINCAIISASQDGHLLA